MDVRTETIEPIRVVYFRGTGPYAKMMPALWAKTHAYAGHRGLRTPDTLFLTIAWSNPRTTPPDQIYADACVSVPADFEPDGDAQVQTISGGAYAIGRYVGNYTGLAAAWADLCDRWLPASGRQARRGPPFEIYRTDPSSTPADQCVTDLFLPIEP